MPSNTRDLAAETLLLMVSATLLFMGGAGLLVGLVLPKMLLGPMLVPDASLAILLIGMSLLATLCHWPWLRWGAAGALLALTAYTLAHNSLDQGVGESLITGERRMTSLSTLFLLWVSACLGGRRWQFTMALVMADHRGWAPAFWRLCAGPALAKR